MTINEIKQNAKESLEGRAFEAFKPALLSIILPTLFKIAVVLIGTLIGISYVGEIFSGNTGGVQYLGGGALIYVCVSFIVLMLMQMYLTYGMNASILSLVRGEEIDFKTVFTKISERLGIVFKVNFKIALEIICIVLVCTILPALLAAIIPIVGFIAVIAGMVFMIVKVSVLGLASSLANYVMNDYGDRTSKEIIDISKKIANKKFGKCVTLILSHLGWFLLAVVAVYAIELVKYLIWEPQFIFGVMIDNTPSLAKLIITAIEALIVLIPSIKVLAAMACFYQTIEPERLFDADYEIISEEKQYMLIAAGLVLLTIISYLGISVGLPVILSKLIS